MVRCLWKLSCAMVHGRPSVLIDWSEKWKPDYVRLPATKTGRGDVDACMVAPF